MHALWGETRGCGVWNVTLQFKKTGANPCNSMTSGHQKVGQKTNVSPRHFLQQDKP